MTQELHPKASLQRELIELGTELRTALLAVLRQLPESESGPQLLGASLGQGKVFAHRLLKATRDENPLAVLLQTPGPEPLRRFLRASRRLGATPASTQLASLAVERFHEILREDIGDRSQLDAILSTWLPSTQAEFELRRKQAIFKARSQLFGVSAATNLATVFLHPSASGERIDVVWLAGLYGLQRWRPGARTKLTTRRFAEHELDRRPTTLLGERVEGLEGLRLDAFCAAPPAELEVRHVGEVVQYILAGEDFGLKATRDLLLAEVNLEELPRKPAPGRRPYVFAEISTPVHLLVFDVFVHQDLYPKHTPELSTYDTAFEGIVDVNDPTRAIDLLESTDELVELGPGLDALAVPEVPHHRELLEHVFSNLAWDPSSFRGWRARVDYPLFGTQVAVSLRPPEPA